MSSLDRRSGFGDRGPTMVEREISCDGQGSLEVFFISSNDVNDEGKGNRRRT